MSPLDPAQLVGFGGALGAVLRYGLTRRLAGQHFPWGTLLVNTAGTFVLAAVTFAGAGQPVLLAVGTGVCGAFTTFSSFSFETVRLWEEGDRPVAALYAAGNAVLAGLAIGLARLLAGG